MGRTQTKELACAQQKIIASAGDQTARTTTPAVRCIMLNPQLAQHIISFDTIVEDVTLKSSSSVSSSREAAKQAGSDYNSWTRRKIDHLLLEYRIDSLSSFWIVLASIVGLCYFALALDFHSSFLPLVFGLAVGTILHQPIHNFRHVAHSVVFRDRVFKQRKAWSEKISLLLGSVGAPLVHRALNYSDLNLQPEQLAFFWSFVQSQVELILELNDTMNLLRLGTSMFFGIGSTNASIERVEKAALARWIKHHHGQLHAQSRMPISLATLRKRVYEILQRQIEGLHAVTGQSCGVAEYDETDVITLSLLSAKKCHAVKLLAIFVDKTRCLDDTTCRAMEHCAHEAERSRHYLLSAVRYAGLTKSSDDLDKSTDSALFLVDKLELLRLALLSYHETTFAENQCDVSTGWKIVEKLEQKFSAAVAEKTQQLKQVVKSDTLSCSDETHSEVVPDSRWEEDVSFAPRTEDYPAFLPQINMGDKSEALSKTVVFSGVACKRMRKPRKRAIKSSNSCVSPSPHFLLVDELHERLRSLPPVDELNLRNGAIVQDDDVTEKLRAHAFDEDPAAYFPATGQAEACDDKRTSSHNLGFLGELQNSIANSLARRTEAPEVQQGSEL